MPLVRYEIRNEHSLANPQLYRTAAKDDPEGLLEGVAMAGLVGIVRQLGDLAEFAAEVFRDLHEEVMATASRGHDLLARVQQLEAEMPAVEKALLSETNQLRFAYTQGVEWHASIRNDQNHCTQGDLPRFIRSSYEECRGPPRLFLLDKFDVAGAGACLKRYTDPSFFRTEWASSELMNAERVQRDKKARREKKKGRRRRNVDGKENILAEQYQSTFSQELSRELSQRNQAHSRMGHQPHSDSSSIPENINHSQNLDALSRHVAGAQGPRQDAPKTTIVSPGSTPETLDNSVDIPGPAVSEVLTSSPPKHHKIENATSAAMETSREWDETGLEVPHKNEIALQAQYEAVATAVDDVGSEGEQFLDALTTMESVADSDSETHRSQDIDADGEADNLQVPTRGQLAASHEDLKVPELRTPADEKSTIFDKQSRASMPLDPSRQDTLLEPRVNNNGQDVKGTSSCKESRASTLLDLSRQNISLEPKAAVNAWDVNGALSARHARMQSSDSISSASSRKAQHVRVLEEPRKGFTSVPYRDLKDEDELTDFYDEGPALPFNSGVQVSKIIAALERGEQAFADRMEKERQGLAMVPHNARSDAHTVHQTAVQANNAGVLEDNNSGSNSPSHFCTSPVEDSASSQDTYPKPHGSVPMRIDERRTSISSHTSLGSIDSVPESPTFSATQSPVSTIRSERSILLSPDRVSLHPETLSPGSPTSVPVLALPPTLQEVRYPNVSSLEHGQGQDIDDPISLKSLSSSPADFPSTPQSTKGSEIVFRSLPTKIIVDETAATLLPLPEDSSDHHSALPTRSLDDHPASTPPVKQPEFVPPVQNSLDISEGLHDLSPTAHDSVPTPTGKPDLNTSPRTQPLGDSHDLSLSPSEKSHDDISISLSLNNNGPRHASTKFEERVLQKPTLPLTPVSRLDSTPDPSSLSPPHHDETLPTLSSVKHDKLSSTSTKSSEPTSQISRDDFLIIPKATHRRFPSLPLVENSEHDFSHAGSSSSRQSPVESMIPSKPTSSSQLSAKFPLKAPYSTPVVARVVHDHPQPIRKGSHNRFPSFPTSEGSMLELPSTSSNTSQLQLTSATPSRHAPDAEVPVSKFVRELPSPSQTLANVPLPLPPPEPERDFPPPLPPPSQALHELPAPPPLSQDLHELPPLPPTSQDLHELPPPPPPPINSPPPSPTSQDLHELPPPPPPPSRALHELPPPPPPPINSPPPSATKLSTVVDGQEGLLEAIASHDKNSLKKVKTMQNPSLRKGDDRSHMLEQIRAKSFNLRHTVVAKVEPPPPRPFTNINVAAILEKANAIRQAFAGSDEDDDDNDDWSDA